MKLRNVKFQVDKTTNKQVQDILFAAGCQWCGAGSKGQEYHHTEAEFLYVDRDGWITYSRLSGSGRAFFNTMTEYRELKVDTKVEVILSEIERPKTILFGRTYYTDELEAALKTLSQAK